MEGTVKRGALGMTSGIMGLVGADGPLGVILGGCVRPPELLPGIAGTAGTDGTAGVVGTGTMGLIGILGVITSGIAGVTE